MIKYIINRIRNQTHTNTLINDALLVDVAKLTATVAQNAQPLTQNTNLGNNATNLSPKKIYAKIKKLTLPKERDEFLRWYQKYLENTIFGNQQQQLRQQHLAAGEKGKPASKPSNNQQVQQQQQNDLQAPNTDDGDLAEADQNCSLNNSSGNSGVSNGNDLNSTYHQQITPDNISSTNASLHLIKTENFNCPGAANGLQYENNENPEENQTINIEKLRDTNNTSTKKNIPNATADGVTILQAAKNLKSHEPTSQLANSNSEKSDLKCEKLEFHEKE